MNRATSPRHVLAALAENGVAPADGEATIRLSAGIDGALRRIAEETLSFAAAGGGDMQFIHAPYGRGKTHFLRAVEHRAREHGFVTAYVDCLDRSPFDSLDETYRSIARCMRPPAAPGFAGDLGVTRVVASAPENKRPGSASVAERLAADKILSPDYRNLARSYAAAGLTDNDDELSESLAALLEATPGLAVAPGRLCRQHPWLLRPLGKLARKNSGPWLRSLLSLPRVLGYSGLVVLFDETETALNKGGTRRILRRLAHLRTFVDYMAVGAIGGCVIYYAVAEDFIETTGDYLGALKQRIERPAAPFENAPPNPRAIWVALDELTDPGPGDPLFYGEIAARIADIGAEAGMPPDARAGLLERLSALANEYAANIHHGRVRDYIKVAAGGALERIANHA